MAIIFSNEKTSAGILFWLAVVPMFCLMSIISLAAFSQDVSEQYLASASGSLLNKIDLPVLNWQEVKDLKPFPKAVKEGFSFIAKDKFGRKKEGTVYAKDRQEAEALLLKMDLKILILQKTSLGNNNPFLPIK